MRRSRLFFLVACLSIPAITAGYALIGQGQVIAPKLLRVEGSHLILRLTKRDAPHIELADEQTIQFRVAGKWLSLEKLDGGRMLIIGSFPDCEQVVGVPKCASAEALRLYLTYRRLSPRAEFMDWLVERGWWDKASKLCTWVYTRLPEHRNWRRVLVEFELPKEPWWSAPGYEPYGPPHTSSAQANEPMRICSLRLTGGRLASEQTF